MDVLCGRVLPQQYTHHTNHVTWSCDAETSSNITSNKCGESVLKYVTTLVSSTCQGLIIFGVQFADQVMRCGFQIFSIICQLMII